MSAEDHNRDPSTHVDPAVEEHNLDSLARGLASGSISRRQAVRWMGGALLGSVLASIPGIAWAVPPERPPKPPKFPKPGKKTLGENCKKHRQCASGSCGDGICVGTEQCAVCPEDCVCALDDSGNIICVRCPGGLCIVRGAEDCQECLDLGLVCFVDAGGPFGSFGCLPPCAA
jgi:hypothetical protein